MILKKHILFTSSLLTLSLLSTVQAANNVLFIGNSYTYGKNGTQSVPDIFDALANAGGQDDPNTEMRAVGGTDFEYHYTDSESKIIAEPPWTHVILQNQSTEPTHVGNVADHMEYGEKLYDLVIANNPDAQVMLYMTWARQASHSIITGTSTSSTFESTDEMLSELVTNYDALAEALIAANPNELPTQVNPVGLAFQRAGANLDSSDPDYIDMYSDGTHANDLGYYLSACVHYSCIYKSSPVGLFSEAEVIALGLDITEAEAAFLEQVAWDTVTGRGLMDENYLIDFGSSSTETSITSALGETWNNVNETQAAIASTVIADLQTSTGTNSTIDLTITSSFNNAHSDGTSDSNIYPSSATQDTLFGNVADYNDLSNVTPVITLSSLDPSTPLILSFYASRYGVSDNQQTSYTITGEASTVVNLDTHDNIDTVAQSSAVYPDADGNLSISISAGPDNTSIEQFASIGVLEMTTYPNSDLEITSQPVSQSVEIGNTATFSITADSPRDIEVQWYADGLEIEDANELSYSIAEVTADLDGTEYSASINNGLFSLTSSSATLTTSVDTTSPEFTDLTLLESNCIELSFSEALDSETATDTSNYLIVNQGQHISISSATLSEDASTVTLTLSDDLTGNYIVLPTSTVTDITGNPLTEDSQWVGSAPNASNRTIYIDFGSRSEISDASDTWNQAENITSDMRDQIDVDATPYVFFSSLLDSENSPTGIGLQMTDSMTYSNNAGTADSIYPAGATQDSFFGQTGSFSSYEDNGQGVFEFTNCDPDVRYDITIFTSRLDTDAEPDNRDTKYELTGASTHSGVLDIVNNENNTLVFSQVQATDEGVITLTVSAGEDNNSSVLFYYLGVIEINVVEAIDTPSLYPPVVLNDLTFIDWIGQGTLLYTDDLTTTWESIDTATEAPHIDSATNQRFYKLSYED
jgi:hypothetical protein